MTALAEACADLATWLPRAGALITEPDTDGTTGGGKPGSSPPWNPAAAAAYFDAAPFLRGLEASARLAVTGHPGPARGGSDGNTRAALAALRRFSYPLQRIHDDAPREFDGQGRMLPCRCAFCRAGQHAERLAAAIQRLPAIDEDDAERWQRITGSVCPFCGLGMLRAQVRARRLTCLRYGSCTDSNGRHPVGEMTRSRLDGSPVIEWADGLVT